MCWFSLSYLLACESHLLSMLITLLSCPRIQIPFMIFEFSLLSSWIPYYLLHVWNIELSISSLPWVALTCLQKVNISYIYVHSFHILLICSYNDMLVKSCELCRQPFQPTPGVLPASLAGWLANPSSVPHPSTSAGPIALSSPNNPGKEVF